MEQLENNESRERILNASIALFSEKGFDATRVNEIAEAAKVNKALIYYYFKSKEDILDCLIDSLFKSVTSIAMDFIHENIVQMVKDGRLDINTDRLHFINEEAFDFFLQQANIYFEKLIEYVLEHRDIIRILLLESLKNGKHHDGLFRLTDFLKEKENNPLYKIIRDVGKYFDFSEDMKLYKFFFSFMPLINFAAYFDDYKKSSSLSDQEVCSSFLRSLRMVTFPFIISEKDIWMWHKKNIE
ncbi:TetR/AcrR family transcriptional regulator [Candidatus Formimonas warabiya]|uniref:TetR family transcriptional regulator n=1 Tax=Formimonas warabiya TaxID=1761012 RepID=A0A3G1KSK4_FORW1|nr:TetR/AcrR family transcriptional regulator [Candidatus Formimonas warabiya]ATW25439.1 TetR family transcriptional regulator [Candidatus Formimonas warabiya]